MIRNAIFSSIFLMTSHIALGQHFGNSPYLKYGFSEFELMGSVSKYDLTTLTQSSAKAFFIKNQTSADIGMSTNETPIKFQSGLGVDNSLNMYSGRLYHGVEGSYTNWGLNGHSAGIKFSQPLMRKYRRDFYVWGEVGYANREFELKEGADKLGLHRKSFNADISARFMFKPGRQILFNLQTLNGYEDISPNLPLSKPMWQNTRTNGTLWMPSLRYVHNLSVNHILKFTYRAESFNQDIRYNQFDWQVKGKPRFDWNSVSQHVSAEQLFRRQRTKVTNVVSFGNYSVSSGGDSMRSQSYSLATMSNAVVYQFKKNKSHLSYHQVLGFHSTEGFLFNPKIKFQRVWKRFRTAIGVAQSMRNPSLFGEFQSFRRLNDRILTPTTQLERYRTAFFNMALPLWRNTSWTVQYSVNELNNKWTINPNENSLVQDNFMFSSVKTQYQVGNGSWDYRRKWYLNMSYSYRERFSGPRLMVPRHLATCNVGYRGGNWSLFKRLPFSPKVMANVFYASEYNLPLASNGQFVQRPGGVYTDLFIKMQMGQAYRYDMETRFESITVNVGVNNLLNAGVGNQVLEAALYNPILPRTLTVGLQAKF